MEYAGLLADSTRHRRVSLAQARGQPLTTLLLALSTTFSLPWPINSI